ncbi:MAG: hypothetical protein AB8F65_14585 [Woeseiaceae bacterium]
MKKQLYRLLVCVVGLSSTAVLNAQQGMDEIVVTGSRMSSGVGSYRSDVVPVVHIKRRPDFMVVDAMIESDSRSAPIRRKEIDKTLASLARQAAKTEHIELGLARVFPTENDDIEYIVDFDIDAVEVVSGRRPDTSRVALVIKSPLLDTDETPDDVYSRIESFVESVDEEGRAIASDSGDMNFSLIGISQFREPLMKLLAEDNEKLRGVFGDDYNVHITGLELPVQWRVSGPMELVIYFPYSSTLIVD